MDKEATLETVEAALDTVDKVKPSSFNLNGTTKGQQVAYLAAAGLVGALAGSGVTYLISKKYLKAKYEEIARQEIEEAKEFYSALKKDQYSSPQEALKTLVGEDELPEETENPLIEDAVKSLRIYAGEVTPPVATEEELIENGEEDGRLEQIEGRVVEVTHIHESVVHKDGLSPSEVVKRNIFRDAQPEDHFDMEEEVANRSKEKPYIIHHDEFYTGEHDYEQMTLTYYEGDDVLVDEREKPIEDTEGLVGNANLLRFGHGSKDKNVVYVRNDRLELDIEVVRSAGEYTREVLGFIEHSYESGRIRKFRGDDM